MKVVTLNWGHGPYSISKIILDIENLLKEENVDFLHVSETGKKQGPNHVVLSGWLSYRLYYVLAHITGRQYSTGFLTYMKFVNICKRYRPDVVHIHCPNAFSINLFSTINYLKKHHIPTVITNHAEFFYTGNCAHSEGCMKYLTGCGQCINYREKTHSLFLDRTAWSWKKMKKAFERNNFVYMVAVSPWVKERMAKSPIVSHLPAEVIYNGIDTDIFCRGNNPEIELEKKEKIVLLVTSFFSDNEGDLKGGFQLIRLAETCHDLPIRFVVAGNSKITSELPDNIELIGPIADQETLTSIYRTADLTIMVSKRETFGMTCAESMCCGTPVVGYLNGGTESIAIPEYSCFVPYGDVFSLKAATLDFLNRNFDRNIISKEACKKYSCKSMASDYFSIYKKIVSRKIQSESVHD